MIIQLFEATVYDAESLISIQEKAFKRLYDIYQDEKSPYLKGTSEFFLWLENSDVSIYKIYVDGIMCGGIAVYKRTDNEYYLARIYILPEFQSKGIATIAIELCESYFPDAKKWTLDFPADQIANKKCYEKSGYVDTGKQVIINDRLTLAIYEKRTEI